MATVAMLAQPRGSPTLHKPRQRILPLLLSLL
jgi:hypothetical protein